MVYDILPQCFAWFFDGAEGCGEKGSGIASESHALFMNNKFRKRYKMYRIIQQDTTTNKQKQRLTASSNLRKSEQDGKLGFYFF